MSATPENVSEQKPKRRARVKSADGKPATKTKANKATEEPAEVFECHFCKKALRSEMLLAKHLCEPKKRWHDRDVPYVRLAYGVYHLFFQINQRKEVNYDHFMKSKHYKLFVKFGKYMHDVKAIEPMEFARFVIEKGAGLPIYEWPTDPVYETYVRHRTARESPDAAAERTLLLMEQWSVETGNPYTDFFRKIETPLAVHWIRSGRLSPWLLYASQSGNGLLNRFSENELGLISQYIDPALWQRRITMNRDKVESLQELLKSAGI